MGFLFLDALYIGHVLLGGGGAHTFCPFCPNRESMPEPIQPWKSRKRGGGGGGGEDTLALFSFPPVKIVYPSILVGYMVRDICDNYPYITCTLNFALLIMCNLTIC